MICGFEAKLGVFLWWCDLPFHTLLRRRCKPPFAPPFCTPLSSLQAHPVAGLISALIPCASTAVPDTFTHTLSLSFHNTIFLFFSPSILHSYFSLSFFFSSVFLHVAHTPEFCLQSFLFPELSVLESFRLVSLLHLQPVQRKCPYFYSELDCHVYFPNIYAQTTS